MARLRAGTGRVASPHGGVALTSKPDSGVRAVCSGRVSIVEQDTDDA